MHRAYIQPDKCICCPKCAAAKVCSLKAIFRISVDEPNVVDMAHCRGCGDCIAPCPTHAVVLKEGS